MEKDSWTVIFVDLTSQAIRVSTTPTTKRNALRIVQDWPIEKFGSVAACAPTHVVESIGIPENPPRDAHPADAWKLAFEHHSALARLAMTCELKYAT